MTNPKDDIAPKGITPLQWFFKVLNNNDLYPLAKELSDAAEKAKNELNELHNAITRNEAGRPARKT